MVVIDSLLEQVKEFYACDDTITIFHPKYKYFASNLKKFIYENNFGDTPEWKKISSNLPYTSRQYMARHEADTILVALENLHRRLLMHENEVFWTYMHPLIIDTSKQLHLDKHYAKAVQAAFVEINDRVKKIRIKIDGKELDGDTLMRQTFSVNQPVLRFEDNATESGKNVQQGYMDIFAGAIRGIRNPNAHENMTTSKDATVRELMFASLLMYKIDDAVAFSGVTD